MNLDHSLKLDLSQKLMMTPELRQAIAILQMSALELSEVIAEEILENPVLEIAEKEGSDSPEPPEEIETSRESEPLDDYFNWADYFNNGMEKNQSKLSPMINLLLRFL